MPTTIVVLEFPKDATRQTVHEFLAGLKKGSINAHLFEHIASYEDTVITLRHFVDAELASPFLRDRSLTIDEGTKPLTEYTKRGE